MLVRLEMDEERMRFLSFDSLPLWPTLFSVVVDIIGGIVLGILYFRSLWWITRRFTEGGRATTTIALMIARFALLVGLLTLASLEGALPLLMMALGVLIARTVVMREVRETEP
jgi:F1F0 ATPase subunit 2